MSELRRDAELSPTLTGYCDACEQYPAQTVRLRVDNETKVTLCSRCATTLAALVYHEAVCREAEPVPVDALVYARRLVSEERARVDEAVSWARKNTWYAHMSREQLERDKIVADASAKVALLDAAAEWMRKRSGVA